MVECIVLRSQTLYHYLLQSQDVKSLHMYSQDRTEKMDSFPWYSTDTSHEATLAYVHVEVTMLWTSSGTYRAPHMYAGRNYRKVNVSKAAGGYWKVEEDIREYGTLYLRLSDYREWGNVLYVHSAFSFCEPFVCFSLQSMGMPMPTC